MRLEGNLSTGSMAAAAVWGFSSLDKFDEAFLVSLVCKIAGITFPMIFVVSKLIDRFQKGKPSWADEVANTLANYSPENKVAWDALKAKTSAQAEVPYEALDKWIKVEREAVQQSIYEAKPKPGIVVPSLSKG